MTKLVLETNTQTIYKTTSFINTDLGSNNPYQWFGTECLTHFPPSDVFIAGSLG